MGFWDAAKGVVGGGLFSKKARGAASDFLLGTPEKRENVSTLRSEQEPLYQQMVNAGLNPGAGGAFGTSADYYRNLLSDNPEDMAAFAAPEMRRFNEDIIPGLSEQFAGMGSGGLSSSGFRNAAVSAGTDLSERLGAMRAQLRQAGAQGLQGIGQAGLGNYSQNMVTEPGTGGMLAPALGAIGTAFGGPPLGALGAAGGQAATDWLKSSTKGQSQPYGRGMQGVNNMSSAVQNSVGMNRGY